MSRVPRSLRCLAVTCCLAAVLPAAACADQQGSLFDVHSLAIAPDGAHVYAGQGLGGTPYVVLARDDADTKLRYASRPNVPGSSLGWAGDARSTIAVAPDSRAVYDSVNDADALRQMTASGDTLSFAAQYTNYTAGITGMTGPAQVAISPDGGCVYVSATHSSPQSIVAFRRDSATNGLTFASTYTAPADTYPYWGQMAFSPDGAEVYVAAGSSGIALFGRNTSTCALQTPSYAPGGTQATQLAMAPDGSTLYAADMWSSHLHVFSRDAGSGALALEQTLTGGAGGDTPGLDGVDGVVVSPDGSHVYTSAATENAVAVFNRSISTGTLAPGQVVRNGQDGVSGLGKVQTLVISPDGKNVYTGSAAPDNAVVSFRRDGATGGLTYLGETVQADAPGSTTGGTVGGIPPSNGSCTGPVAPSGPVGVSIDNGARYTDDPVVTVAVVWPRCANSLTISNDGGFRAATTRSLSSKVKWTLDSSGPERLPKTIYVRFDGATQTFQDDIILDETAPRIISATVTGGPSSGTAAAARAKTLRLRAKDNLSGVKRMQVTRSRKHPGKLRSYRARVALGTGKSLYVRVRDGAGNFSRWRHIRVR